MESKYQIDRRVKNTPEANDDDDDDNCSEHPRRMNIKIKENIGIKNTVNNDILTPANFVGKEFSIYLGPPINIKNLSTYRKKDFPAENDIELENPKRMKNKTNDNDITLSTSSYATLSRMNTPSQFIGPFDNEFLVRKNKKVKVQKKSKRQLVDTKNSIKQKKMAFNRFFYYSNSLITKSQRKRLCNSKNVNFNPHWVQTAKSQRNSQNVSISLIRKIKLLKKTCESTKIRQLSYWIKMSLEKQLTTDSNMFVNSFLKSHLVKCYQKLSKYYLKIMKLCYNTFEHKSISTKHDKKHTIDMSMIQCFNNMKTKNKKKTTNYFISNIILPVFLTSAYYYDISYSHNFNLKAKQTQRRTITNSTDIFNNKMVADVKFMTDVIPTNINDIIVKMIKTNGEITYDDVTALLHTYQRTLGIAFTNQQMTRMADNFCGFYKYNNKCSGNNTVIGDGVNEDSNADDNDPLNYFELVDSDVDIGEDLFNLPSTSANQIETPTYMDFIGLNSTRSSVTRLRNAAENKLINENKTKLVEKCYDYFFNVNFLKMMSKPNEKSNCVDNIFEIIYNGRDLNDAHSVSQKLETITKSLSSFSPIIRFNKTNDMKNIAQIDGSMNNFDMIYYYMSQRSILNNINIPNTNFINDNTIITETDFKKMYAAKEVIKNSGGIDNIIHRENTSTSAETTTFIDVENLNSSSSLNSTHPSNLQKNMVLKCWDLSLIDVYYYTKLTEHDVIMEEVHNTLSGEVNDISLNDNITLVENDLQENNSDRIVENEDTCDDIINHGCTSTLTDAIKLIDVENIISKEKHAENVEEKETNLNNSIYEVIDDFVMHDKVNDTKEVEYLDNNKLEMEIEKSFSPKSCGIEKCDGRIIDSSNYTSDIMNEVAVVTEENINDSMVDNYFDGKNLEIEVNTLPDDPNNTLLNKKIVVENEFIENTSKKFDEKATNFEDIINHENISISREQMEIVDTENFNCVNSINSIISDVSTSDTNFDMLSTPFMQSELDKNITVDICEIEVISDEKESENVDDIETISTNRFIEVINNITTDQFFYGDEQLGTEIQEALPQTSNNFADVRDLIVLSNGNVAFCGLNEMIGDFNTSINDVSLNEDGIFAENYIEVNVRSEEEEAEVITMNYHDIDRFLPGNNQNYRLHNYIETIDLTNDDDDDDDNNNTTDLHYLHNTSNEDNCKVVLSQIQKNHTYEGFVFMYNNDINKLAYKLRQAGIGIPIAKEDIAASRMTVTFIRTYKRLFEEERHDVDVVRDGLVMNVLKNIVNYIKKKDRRTIGHVENCKMTIGINITFNILNVDQCFAETHTNSTLSSSFFFSDVRHNYMSVDGGLEEARQNLMVNLLNGENFDMTFRDINRVPPTNVCTIMIKEILNINLQNKIRIQIKTEDDTCDEMTNKHQASNTVDEVNDRLSTTDDQSTLNELLIIADDRFIINELSKINHMNADCFNDFLMTFDDLPTGFDNAGSLLFP